MKMKQKMSDFADIFKDISKTNEDIIIKFSGDVANDVMHI